MIRATTEPPADVIRWMQSEAVGLWPAIVGSLSFRRSPCGHKNCRACLSGEQHPSQVLYGRHNGRRGLTAPQVLRSLVVMRVKNLDYRELRERIADGVTLRQFTDFYCDPVPKHDAFNRGFNRLTPQTLKAINDMVVQAAVALGLEDGAKLRVDTTVVETDIHHPTDNTLLWDVVRVVTRLVGRLAKALKMRRIKGFRDRRRSAHRRMYEIQRMTTRQRQERQTTIYRALIGIAQERGGDCQNRT